MDGDEMDDDHDVTDSEESKDNVQSDRIRQYANHYIGAYEVFIRQCKTPLKHVEISKKINEKFPNDIKSLVKVNPYKIRVEFTNIASANALPKCDFLSEYRVYIPAKSVEISGLITISTDTSVEEIISNGKGKFFGVDSCTIKVLDAYRFQKTIVHDNGSSKKIDTPFMRVTFEGTELPKWLVIYGLLVKVEVHTPKIMHCKNCLGHGHTEKFCTSNSVCSKCGGKHASSSCQSEPVICTHCRKTTTHSHSECPVYRQHCHVLKIKAIAAASSQLPTRESNPFAILENRDEPTNVAPPLSNDANNEGQPKRKRRKPSKPTPSTSSGPKIQPPFFTPSQTFAETVQNLNNGQSSSGAIPRKKPSIGPKIQPLFNTASPFAEPGQTPNNGQSSTGATPRKKPGKVGRSGNSQAAGGVGERGSVQDKHVKPVVQVDCQREVLKDAVKSFIASKQLHPLLSTVLNLIASPIIDWIWPMISPFYKPFIVFDRF
jgi:hypothetical protein